MMSSVPLRKSSTKVSLFSWVDPVQPREGLNCVQAGQHLVHEHSVEEGLVKPVWNFSATTSTW